jgi:hypothetical protein
MTSDQLSRGQSPGTVLSPAYGSCWHCAAIEVSYQEQVILAAASGGMERSGLARWLTWLRKGGSSLSSGEAPRSPGPHFSQHGGATVSVAGFSG